MLVGVASVLAVWDLGIFELDRNAVASWAPGDDWNSLPGSSQEFTGILADIGADGGTQFHGGGSKDDEDITEWLWNPGEPLDKDDITNAYAAAYVNTVDTTNHDIGDLIIYFGLDRFANNGSAQVGFWFLQSPVGLTNIASQGGFEFSGAHTDGDILVQSNFSNGGVISSISVFQWLSGGLVSVLTAADCVPGVADTLACGTVNQADAPAPWPFTPKFGVAGTFPAGSFFEGGINVSALIPDAGCFSGFIAETRTSTPFDSRLKDFVLGEFDLCEIEVTKTGDELSKVGDDVDYTITIENTGALTVWKDDISDTVFGNLVVNGVNQADPNAWTDFNFATADPCGASLAPGADCTIEVTRTVQEGDDDPLPNTVTATYRGHSDLSGSAVSASDDHEVDLFQPGVDITKDGSAVSKVGDDVTYDYTIENTGSADSPNLILDSLMDTGDNNGGLGLGDLTALAGYDTDCDELAPGDICTFSISYTVLEGDDDPLNNTVTAHYHPDGFENDITDEDSHEVDLFQPGVDITKDGSAVSKVGDDVTYDYTIENTGSADSPNLILDSLMDTGDNNGGLGLGDLTALAGYDTDCDELAPGDICTFSITYTVLEGDDDPLNNTVTAHYHPDGFENDITDEDSHEVDLFQPGVDITKDGSAVSKVGDDVTYDYTIENTGSADSPNLILDSLMDTGDNNGGLGLGDLTALAGYDTDCDELAPGDICTFSITYTVLEGDDDPLNNTVTAHYHPDGFENDITDEDSHEVDLFQPGVDITKDGSAVSKVGDDVTYDYTIENTGSADSPNLILDSLMDTGDNNGGLGLGDLTALAGYDTDCDELAPGDICTFSITYTVLEGDDDPLNNTVTAHYHPDGFENDITDEDSHEVDLFQPGVDITKDGSAVSKVGDDVTYDYTIENTGSADSPNLILDSLMDTGDNNGGLGLGDLTALAGYDTDCDELAPGDICTFSISYTVLEGDDDPLNNTVTAHYHPDGFENDITDEDSHEVDLFQPSVTVDKSGTTVSKVGDDVTYTYLITNTSVAGSPNLILDSIMDTGDNNGGLGSAT